MVSKYPVDITNGLSNIRLYCNIVKGKTTPLLTNVPMDSLYKNYFYKNRMLILCSELSDLFIDDGACLKGVYVTPYERNQPM